MSPGGGREHLRGLPADLSMVPLSAVGEVLLVGALELLHGTNVGPEDQINGGLVIVADVGRMASQISASIF